MNTKRLLEEYKAERQIVWAESARQAQRRKAAEGGVIGAAPLGYVNRRRGDRTWVEVDSGTCPLVAEAFALAADGKRSLRQIVALLEEQGLRTRTGKRLQAVSLQRILTNPFYAGVVRYAGDRFCAYL